jgi:hypothetical protein
MNHQRIDQAMTYEKGMYFRKNQASKILAQKPKMETDQVKTAELSVGKYKHGKQTQIMTFEQFYVKMLKARLKASLYPEQEAYLWLLYYTGVRKSEGYERVADDVKITPELFIIDFHQRKKNGATVDPLEIPRKWPGVELLIEISEKTKATKPLTKMIFYYEMQQRKSRIEKNHWLFPNIQSTEAWRIAKRVLGREFYPHFFRLNRLTEIGTDKTCNLVRMKSFSGIKTIRILEAYLGVSKNEQNQAIDFMDQHINSDITNKKGGSKHG